jgi:hypothetical protein
MKKRTKKVSVDKVNSYKLIWTSRYSGTMENDEMGRWARILYLKSAHRDFGNMRLLSWVSRRKAADGRYVYVADCAFPVSCGDHDRHITAFDLETIKEAVEAAWYEFMKLVDGKPFKLIATNYCMI